MEMMQTSREGGGEDRGEGERVGSHELSLLERGAKAWRGFVSGFPKSRASPMIFYMSYSLNSSKGVI